MPKIPNIHVPRYVTASAVQAVRAAINDAVRLGLTWRLRPGTVVGSQISAPESVPVRIDGDASVVRARSMVGAVSGQQRVWCIQVPPAGIYILGTIGVSRAVPLTRTFTSSGTWTRPAGLAYVRVYGVGGGGQSGGCPATAAGQSAEAAGGSAGGYAESLLEAAVVGPSVTVTVGAGGSGAAAGAAGNSGGNSAFGTFWTAGGGGGGPAGTATSTTAAADASGGGTSTGGNVINLTGDEGGNGRVVGGAPVMANFGAGSKLGSSANSTAANTLGISGRLYGSGASGSRRGPSQATAIAGQTGSVGIVVVEEFY